uniref:Uncharacterized protein n=1 Tax=Oreochromis niloticus TaxID=8128 RepID=A0A669BWJ9_ORENI
MTSFIARFGMKRREPWESCTHFTPGVCVTATKRSAARFSRALPLFLGVDEFGEVGLQLALLVDPPLLHAVPALLLSDAQRAGDVVAKVQPLLFCQIISCRRKQRIFLCIFHLQVTLTHEEMCFDRLAVELQSLPAVCQSFVVLLQLHVAQRSVGVVPRCPSPDPYYGFAVAGCSLQVFAAQEESVSLLLQLLSRHRGILLRTFGHFVPRAGCTASSCRFALLPYPDAGIQLEEEETGRERSRGRVSVRGCSVPLPGTSYILMNSILS